MDLFAPAEPHPAEAFEHAAKLATEFAGPEGSTLATMAALFTAMAANTRTTITADTPECPNCLNHCPGHESRWGHAECGEWLENCTCPVKHFIAAAESFIEHNED